MSISPFNYSGRAAERYSGVAIVMVSARADLARLTPSEAVNHFPLWSRLTTFQRLSSERGCNGWAEWDRLRPQPRRTWNCNVGQTALRGDMLMSAPRFMYYLLWGFEKREAFPAVWPAGSDLGTLVKSHPGKRLSAGISSQGYVNQ